MKKNPEKKIISSEEVANYVVCPEAWRLKYLGKGQRQQTARTQHGRKLRKEWVEKQDLSTTLRSYAKVAYLLLVILVIVVFMLEQKRTASEAVKKLTKPQIVTPK